MALSEGNGLFRGWLLTAGGTAAAAALQLFVTAAVGAVGAGFVRDWLAIYLGIGHVLLVFAAAGLVLDALLKACVCVFWQASRSVEARDRTRLSPR